LSSDPDRVAASRLLLSYIFGAPTALVEVRETHDLGESVVAILERIATSDEHRQHLEAIEKRRRSNAVTVEVEDEPADQEAS
jgi:hypothetical protein